ncbi:MAG: NUDIX hydrolase [Bryobacteraceae bacterium]|nr:NUDIX hydrolase [Bryobacteraceae bacterium]
MTDDRAYPPRPILGVGALLFDAGRVLLVERGKEPLKGYWSLPGGAVETGESLRDAIRREVLEETGLEIEPGGVAEIFERITPDADGRAHYHYVLIDYLCTILGGEPRAASDVADVRWVPVANLSDYRLTSGTQPVIERAFRGHMVL